MFVLEATSLNSLFRSWMIKFFSSVFTSTKMIPVSSNVDGFSVSRVAAELSSSTLMKVPLLVKVSEQVHPE